MKTNEDLAIQILSQQIKKVVKQFITNAGYDRTVPGIISAVLSDGKYKVKIKNEEHTLYSATDMVFSVNESVWITIPQNNLNKKYISGRRRN